MRGVAKTIIDSRKIDSRKSKTERQVSKKKTEVKRKTPTTKNKKSTRKKTSESRDELRLQKRTSTTKLTDYKKWQSDLGIRGLIVFGMVEIALRHIIIMLEYYH